MHIHATVPAWYAAVLVEYSLYNTNKLLFQTLVALELINDMPMELIMILQIKNK